jgi:hypothetical protein
VAIFALFNCDSSAISLGKRASSLTLAASSYCCYLLTMRNGYE